MAAVRLVEILRSDYRLRPIDYSSSALQRLPLGLAVVRSVRMILRALAVFRTSDLCYVSLSQSLWGNIRDLTLMLFAAGKPLVVQLHGGGIDKTVFGRSRAVRHINHFIYRCFVTKAVVLSDSLRTRFALVLPDWKVSVVCNAVSQDVFLSVAEIRKKHQSTQRLHVLYLSNLMEEKGYRDLVTAIAGLPSSVRSRICLHLAGGVQYADDSVWLKSIAEKTDIPMTYHGPVDGERKLALLRQAHVFALPTYYRYEGQPISLLEAYAAGCVAVVTPHGGIPDVFAEPSNGRFVVPRSVQSIQSALVALVDMAPVEREQIGLRNLRLAEERFNNESHRQQLKRVFDEALHAHRYTLACLSGERSLNRRHS